MNIQMNEFFWKKYEWIFRWIDFFLKKYEWILKWIDFLWKNMNEYYMNQFVKKTNESYYESTFFYIKTKQIYICKPQWFLALKEH